MGLERRPLQRSSIVGMGQSGGCWLSVRKQATLNAEALNLGVETGLWDLQKPYRQKARCHVVWKVGYGGKECFLQVKIPSLPPWYNLNVGNVGTWEKVKRKAESPEIPFYWDKQNMLLFKYLWIHICLFKFSLVYMELYSSATKIS